MDALTLFPDGALDARSRGPDACVAPIGRRGIGRRGRARSLRPWGPSLAVALLELRQMLERQHLELVGEVRRLRLQRRNEYETGPAILKRLVSIERHLRLTETPVAPQPSRRHPMGA